MQPSILLTLLLSLPVKFNAGSAINSIMFGVVLKFISSSNLLYMPNSP